MNTVGIRIEVPEELYKILLSNQGQRKKETGRKPALSALILEYCISGINNSVQKNVQSKGKSVQNSVQNKEPSIDLLQKSNEKRLQYLEESLIRWDKALVDRENRVRDYERELFVEKSRVLELKDSLIEERNRTHQQGLAGPERIVEMKILNYELQNKDEKLKELGKVVGELKERIKNTENEPRSNKDTPSFWDIVIKNLPLIIGAAGVLGLYLLGRRKENKELPSYLKPIAGFFDHLKPEEKEKLGKLLVEVAKNNEGKEKQGKSQSTDKETFKLKIKKSENN